MSALYALREMGRKIKDRVSPCPPKGLQNKNSGLTAQQNIRNTVFASFQFCFLHICFLFPSSGHAPTRDGIIHTSNSTRDRNDSLMSAHTYIFFFHTVEEKKRDGAIAYESRLDQRSNR